MTQRETEITYNVRNLDYPAHTAYFMRLDHDGRRDGSVTAATLGRGEINLIRARRMAELARSGIGDDPGLSRARRARSREWVSDRVRRGIRAVFDRALELERDGRSIVHLEIGRPHLGSPPVAVRAAVAALEAGTVHYTANRGLPELRAAIADRTGRADAEIVVTAGGSEAVAAAVLAIIEPGDEAIVLDPAWPHYDGHVRLAGGVPVHVPCRGEDGFQPDPERVRAAITPSTRLLVVSSPSNPTGRGDRAGERGGARGALSGAGPHRAIGRDLCELRLRGAEHRSIASEPGMAERTVIADSCSKTWSMTGWRVGWAIAPRRSRRRSTWSISI